MLYRGDAPVDFRELIHTLGLPGRRLHPIDGHRYLTPSGIAIMAEGVAAEVASPPISLGPGFARELDAWSASGFAHLRGPLDSDIRLKGCSTHLSVECDPRLADEVAWLYAQTFAPAFMLLLDDSGSPGLLVRSRPSRLELCGEFATDSRLRAAAAMAAGSVLALSDALRDRQRPLPPRLRGMIEPARRRFGWYVDRRSFGPDLYRQGRNVTLRRLDGGTISGQAQLEACWEIARDALVDRGWAGDLDDADRVVGADLSLPCESPVDDRRQPSSQEPPPVHPIGRMLAVRRRPGFTVQATSATWDYAAFEISDGERKAVCSVPRPLLGTFLSQLDAGALDDVLVDSVGSVASNRTLERHSQTLQPGFWGGIHISAALMPADRRGVGGGAVGRVPTAGSATAPEVAASAGTEPKYSGTSWGGGSQGAIDSPPAGLLGGTLAGLPWRWIAAAAAAMVILGVVLLGGGDSDSGSPSSGSSSSGGGAAATTEPTACELQREEQLVLAVSSEDIVGGVIPEDYLKRNAYAKDFKTPRFQWSVVPPETTEIAILIMKFTDDNFAAFLNDPNPRGSAFRNSNERWVLTGLDPSLTSLANTSLTVPAPAGAAEQKNQGPNVRPNGVPSETKFVGPAFPERHFMFAVLALCERSGSARDINRGYGLAADAVAIGWFFAEPPW